MGRVGKVDPRYFYEKRIFLQPPISTQTHEGCFHGFIVEDHGKNDKSPGTSVSTGDFLSFNQLPHHTIETLYNPPHSKQEWLSAWWLNHPSEILLKIELFP